VDRPGRRSDRPGRPLNLITALVLLAVLRARADLVEETTGSNTKISRRSRGKQSRNKKVNG
jgi:hypothetical protein